MDQDRHPHRHRRGPKRLAQTLALIHSHGDELELELLRMGYRLHDMGWRLSWHDIWLIAVNAAPGSPLAVALDPRLAWGRTDHWLRSIEYSLRWLTWAKTRDGQRNRKRPKPVPEPKPARKPDPELVAMDTDELDALLARPRTPVSERTL